MKQIKLKIPISLKREVWLKNNGKVFNAKCKVNWCTNEINTFTFECGHNIPESKGGKTSLENLLPICSSCNKSMGNRYTIIGFASRFSEYKSIKQMKIRWISLFDTT